MKLPLISFALLSLFLLLAGCARHAPRHVVTQAMPRVDARTNAMALPSSPEKNSPDRAEEPASPTKDLPPPNAAHIQLDMKSGRLTIAAPTMRLLRRAIVATLLSPADPVGRSEAPPFSHRADGTDETSPEPFLYGMIADHRNMPIASRRQAEVFCSWLLDRARRSVAAPARQGRWHQVSIPLSTEYMALRRKTPRNRNAPVPGNLASSHAD